MNQIKETNKLELEKVKLQTENEMVKIQAQLIGEAKLHEEKVKTDLIAKQFENPAIQEVMSKMLGAEMGKLFSGKWYLIMKVYSIE